MKQAANLDLADIGRLEHRGVRLAEAYGAGTVFNEDNPLEGITKKQRVRTRKAGDVLNIGSGTRCTECGMLYFCWVDNCRACGRQMEYNLGSRES